MPQVCNAHSYFEISGEWADGQVAFLANKITGDDCFNYKKLTIINTKIADINIHYYGQYGMVVKDATKLLEADTNISLPSGSICNLIELENNMPQEIASEQANANIKGHLYAYRCDFYDVLQGTEYGENTFEDTVNGDKYFVRIGIVNDPNDTTKITYFPTAVPSGEIKKTYIGQCNVLDYNITDTTTTNMVDNATILLTKHNNF